MIGQLYHVIRTIDLCKKTILIMKNPFQNSVKHVTHVQEIKSLVEVV